MSELKSGEVTPEKTTKVDATTEKTAIELQLEQTQKEFEAYREAQAKAREEIRENSEKRFFKEGATKVENELRSRLGIDDKLTGDELFNSIEEKLTGKAKKEVEQVESTLKTSYEERLKTLEQALANKDAELSTFQAKITEEANYNKIKSFANSVLTSGEYKLSENTTINQKRLESAVDSVKGLKIDYSGVEPVVLGDDNFPMYDATGKKVTLKEKLSENLNIFFDKAPAKDEKLQLLNGESKRVEISSSISDIDTQLRKAKTAEEYSTLLATKEKLINTKK